MAAEDLIPVTKRTKAEAKEISRKGGIASGVARRRKKTWQEMAQAISSLQPKLPEAVRKQLRELGIDEEEITMQFLTIFKQQERALKGDLPAAVFVRDTAGEKPTDNLKMSGYLNNDIVITVGGETDDD